MTELELLELLGDVQSGYLQQAEAFRQGRLKVTKERTPLLTSLKVLSVAAMFVLILGAGYWGLQDLAAKEASEKASEAMAKQSAAAAETTDEGSDTENVTPELLEREATENLTFLQDGVAQTCPADLFIGDGYSLYIPQEGWVHQVVDWNGISADQWVNAEETMEEFWQNTTLGFASRDAMRKYYEKKYPNRLTILFYPGLDNHTSRDWVEQAKPEWNLVEDAWGDLYGDGTAIIFRRTETGDFICIEERTAGESGDLVGTMDHTFLAWPSELR